ncbi:MAG TPA: hypothetical protein DC049_09225 [Spirochaetia bacterium]|nr:hypothetical protein [Spirochaetia bacterium]
MQLIVLFIVIFDPLASLTVFIAAAENALSQKKLGYFDKKSQGSGSACLPGMRRDNEDDRSD